MIKRKVKIARKLKRKLCLAGLDYLESAGYIIVCMLTGLATSRERSIHVSAVDDAGESMKRLDDDDDDRRASLASRFRADHRVPFQRVRVARRLLKAPWEPRSYPQVWYEREWRREEVALPDMAVADGWLWLIVWSTLRHRRHRSRSFDSASLFSKKSAKLLVPRCRRLSLSRVSPSNSPFVAFAYQRKLRFRTSCKDLPIPERALHEAASLEMAIFRFSIAIDVRGMTTSRIAWIKSEWIGKLFH